MPAENETRVTRYRRAREMLQRRIDALEAEVAKLRRENERLVDKLATVIADEHPDRRDAGS